MALKPLAEVSLPNLIDFNRSDMVDEIVEKIKTHPDWDSNWDGDLYQNASQMILQFFTFLYEKNATAFNKWIRETFLNQSYSDKAIYNNLAQMKADVQQNTESSVVVTGYIHDELLDLPLIIPLQQNLTGYDLNNQDILFEIFPEVIDGEYDYLNNVIVYPTYFTKDHFEVYAYSGETFNFQTEITGLTYENFYIDVDYDDIISGSIQVYYKNANNEMIKLRKLSEPSFVVEPYIDVESATIFPNGVPHYLVRSKENGRAEILFGSEVFGGAFDETHVGGVLEIYGRTGGGSASQVVARSINYRTNIQLTASRTLDITFINIEAAYGGSDREDIELSKIYGPLRTGRGKPIVQKTDAELALKSYLVKHFIQTPEYSEISNKVQILHSFHYMVPQRDFASFEFPSPYTSDTLQTYVDRFLASLNTFCNVTGTHDQIVDKEFISYFSKDLTLGEIDSAYQLTYELVNKNPLAATLSVTAWNYLNNIVDHIEFNDNYYTSIESYSATPNEHAELKSNNFGVLNVIQGINDRLVLKFDQSSVLFEYTLPQGTKTSEELAIFLQSETLDKISNDVNGARGEFIKYYNENFQFFSYERTEIDSNIGEIVITSPSYGSISKITIVDHGYYVASGYDLYTFLGFSLVGLSAGMIVRPSMKTGLVFLPQCYYNHDSGQMLIKCRSDVMTTKETENYSDHSTEWIQNTSVEDSTEISLILREEDYTTLSKLQIGQDLEVVVYGPDPGNPSSEIILDSAYFQNIQVSDSHSAYFPVSGGENHDVFDTTNTNNNFNYLTSEINLYLKKGILTDIYAQNFEEIYEIQLYKLQSDQITVDTTFEIIKFREEGASWHQDIYTQDGPTIKLSEAYMPRDSGLGMRYYVVEIFKLVDGTTPTTIAKINWGVPGTTDPVDYGNGVGVAYIISSINTPSVWQGVPVYTPDHSDVFNSEITFQAVDGVIDTSADDYYTQGFKDFDRIEINYLRKSYDYLTCNYNPNPYAPEKEAKTYKNILGSSSKRMIGLEDIIKTVDFAPRGIELTITISKDFSLTIAQQEVEDLIHMLLDYSNTNYNHLIGTRITESVIKNLINKEITDRGIVDITIDSTDPYSTLTDDEMQYVYSFFFPQSVVDRLANLESTYSTQLAGLSDLFQIKVNAIREVS